jgi:ribosomal protein L21
MLNYLVAEIKGKQYKVMPNRKFNVDFLGDDIKTLACETVMLMSDGDNLSIGAPFLKDKVTFDVIATTKGKKIRVAKFHAKANTRKVTGATKKYTTLMLKA